MGLKSADVALARTTVLNRDWRGESTRIGMDEGHAQIMEFALIIRAWNRFSPVKGQRRIRPDALTFDAVASNIADLIAIMKPGV